MAPGKVVYQASNMPWGYWAGMVVAVIFGVIWVTASLASGHSFPWVLVVLVVLAVATGTWAATRFAYRVTLEASVVTWQSVATRGSLPVEEIREIRASGKTNVVSLDTGRRTVRVLVRPHSDPVVPDEDGREFLNWAKAAKVANPALELRLGPGGRWTKLASSNP